MGESAGFYEGVFGWNIRRRSDGEIAFDDGVGEVSGTWVTDRVPSSEPGLLLYVMVESVEETLQKIVEAGGEIVRLPRRARARRSRRFVTLPETSSASFTSLRSPLGQTPEAGEPESRRSSGGSPVAGSDDELVELPNAEEACDMLPAWRPRWM